MNKEDLEIGMKVLYMPTKQKGIVKSFCDNSKYHCFVVYNCADDRENYQNYTAERTPIIALERGRNV